jgi:single-stranded DNA-binding protein
MRNNRRIHAHRSRLDYQADWQDSPRCVCANYSFKDKGGEWKDDQHWNEVTIFAKPIQDYVNQHVSKGDLVHVRGRVRQNSYERDGQRIYTGRPDRRRGRPAGPGSRTISRMNGPRGEARVSPSSERLWCRVRMAAFAIGSDAPGHDRRDSFS